MGMQDFHGVFISRLMRCDKLCPDKKGKNLHSRGRQPRFLTSLFEYIVVCCYMDAHRESIPFLSRHTDTGSWFLCVFFVYHALVLCVKMDNRNTFFRIWGRHLKLLHQMPHHKSVDSLVPSLCSRRGWIASNGIEIKKDRWSFWRKRCWVNLSIC